MFNGSKQVTEQERVITVHACSRFSAVSLQGLDRKIQADFGKSCKKVQAHTYQTEYSTGLSQATSEKAFS